jgi:hypothetical protein
MTRRALLMLLGLVVPALVAIGPRAAMAHHESTGIVVWAGDGEVMLWAGDHFHVLAVTPQTLLIGEAGRPIRKLAIGERVRETCTPAPDGEAVAVQIEILPPAWQEVEVPEA